MKKATAITCVLLDIGGVLLTNGWDHLVRRRAAANFKLEWAEMEARHRLTFEVYEEGKLTMDEYLALVVFHEKRSFTPAQFRNFMFAQSKSFPKMIALVSQLKLELGMKIAIVSNEGHEPESPFSAPARWNCIAPEADCETKRAFAPKKPAFTEEKRSDSLPSLPRHLIESPPSQLHRHLSILLCPP